MPPQTHAYASQTLNHMVSLVRAPRFYDSAQQQTGLDALDKARANIHACLDLQAIPMSLRKFFASSSLEGMKTRLIEGERYWLTTQALPDLYDHIRAVRDEFTGKAEMHFYHAALIIKIRRNTDLTESLRAFRALWNQHGMFLMKNLNSRWVVSALDTFADHGEAAERGGALAISMFVNMLKLADTEYLLTAQNAYDENELHTNREAYPELWDGVRVFHLPDDDSFANMVKRMRRTLATTPLFALLFESLLHKAVNHNTVLNRLAQHHLRHLW